jgi:hypothetical protein
MENLEEMKKCVADFKKRKTFADRYSGYAIITSLRIFDLVFDRLMLRNKKPTMPSTIEMNFLVSLINRKEPFTIEGIRLDLLAGMPISDVAMKYCEPQEVVAEILERNLRSEGDIVISKIYNVKELCKVFKKRLFITEIPLLMELSNKKNKESIHWWTGDVLLKNYDNIVNYFNKKTDSIKIGGILCVTVIQATKLLNINRNTTDTRMQNKQNIFGVKLSTKKIKRYGGNRHNVYIPLEEVKKAKNNIKYYIKPSDFFNFNVMTAWHMRLIRKQYLYTYHKKIDFSSHYLRKESLENFITLAEQYGYKKEDLIKRD